MDTEKRPLTTKTTTTTAPQNNNNNNNTDKLNEPSPIFSSPTKVQRSRTASPPTTRKTRAPSKPAPQRTLQTAVFTTVAGCWSRIPANSDAWTCCLCRLYSRRGMGRGMIGEVGGHYGMGERRRSERGVWVGFVRLSVYRLLR